MISLIIKKWKVFVIAFAIQVIFILIGTNPFSFWQNAFQRKVAPIPEVDEIRDKLSGKVNNFTLYARRELIPSVKASGEYEKAKAYIVADLDTGEILASKNPDSRLPIASLTKVMTAVVALDLASPEDEFVVSQRAKNIIPTKIGVVPGEKMLLSQLLWAALLTSANDAVQVIKEGVEGKYDQPVFTRAMNQKAEFLGLRNTNFENPQGFDERNHFSSARDLAILSKYAIENYPLIAKIVKDDYEFLPENDKHKQFDLYNWNGLLGVYPGAYGVKIGYTDDAGRTTIVTAQRNGKRVVAVLLGAPGTISRDLWAGQLLDLGFSNYDISPANITTPMLKQKYSTWKYFY